MAIVSLDGLLAGMQPANEIIKATGPTMVVGRMYSFFHVAGIPAQAAVPAPGMAGEALTSYEGQIPFANPASGNAYLARWAGMSTAAGTWLLCDRLWHNSGINLTITTPQDINSATFPARDQDGATNGKGVLVGLEVRTATGAGTPTLTLGYTNSAGTDSRTETNLIATAASSAIGTFYPFRLQGADQGVRSIQTYQQSATWTSGAVHLVAYRVLARAIQPAANTPWAIDAITGGMPIAWNNTVPFLLFVPAATTASVFQGSLTWSHG
jgi:hypothetical protein